MMKYGKQHLYEQPVNLLTELGPQAEQFHRNAAAQGQPRPPIIRLHIGEPSFQTPEHIRLAAIRSLTDEAQTYGPAGGHLWLRELVAEKVTQVNGYHVKPEHVAITMGGTGAIQMALNAILTPGDEVLLPNPCWSTYLMQLNTCGAIIRQYSLNPDNNWLPDLTELSSLITPNTRAIIINSPGNPSGTVFPASLMAQLMDFARKHNLYLLSDECYDELVFDAPHISPATFLSPKELEEGHFIGVYTFSKTYAMTGWRVGYLVTGSALLKTIIDVQNGSLTCINTAMQRGAEAALTGPREEIHAMLAEYQKRRDLVVRLLQEKGRYVYTPQGAFYILVDIFRPDGMARQSLHFAWEYLYKEHNILVAPGKAFGTGAIDRYVRVSLAASVEDLILGISTICQVADMPDLA